MHTHSLYPCLFLSEFENLAMRDEELPELDELARACPFDPRGGAESKQGKANILLQVRPAGTLPGWQPGYHWRGPTVDTQASPLQQLATAAAPRGGRAATWPFQLHRRTPPGRCNIAAARLATAAATTLLPPLHLHLCPRPPPPPLCRPTSAACAWSRSA